MSDKLVFDLAQEVEGAPNVFVRKDWINILDNQNQNYNNNQSVLDTSQLSNSNKYMSYRESYFSIPFLLTLATLNDTLLAGVAQANAGSNTGFLPGGRNVTAGAVAPTYLSPDGTALPSNCDNAIGLKNWFGQIIHSFTLDYNGTTIIQQTPYVNMWNSFKLMTSLSMSDVRTQGATIGFYPDDATSWTWTPSTGSAAVNWQAAGAGAVGVYTPSIVPYSPSGSGICNNTNAIENGPVSLGLFNGRSGRGNTGFYQRQQYVNFDGDALTGSYIASLSTETSAGAAPAVANWSSQYGTYNSLISGGVASASNLLWKSYVLTKVNQQSVTLNNAAAYIPGVWQCAIIATVYLKHVHSFFNMCPLLKGVFMKMTMNLNNTSTQFTTLSALTSAAGALVAGGLRPLAMYCNSVANPLGGVNPLMIASGELSGASGVYCQPNSNAISTIYPRNGGACLFATSLAPAAALSSATQTFRMNISVGNTCLDNTLTNVAGVTTSNMSKSVYLYIPAYTFNPVFEQAYLSSPVKQIKYTDIYQYQVLGVGATNGQFNNLLTNGIANIKSVLILPFYSATGNNATLQVQPQLPTAGAVAGALQNIGAVTIPTSTNTGFVPGVPVFQSPFDTAGTGTTSPLCAITNFNIQVSGQNAIYNMEKYSFEQWNNQLYGQNAVNGGLTDGLTSGLIDRVAFDNNYCYYYVNVERMLPVEQSVPKSIQVLGSNMSTRAIDLYCFIEYGVDISIDALTGARV